MSDYSFQVQQVQQEINITLGKIQELAESQPTLLDRFAMAALTGEISNPGSASLLEVCAGDFEATAMLCYAMADAMMEARAETPSDDEGEG